MDKAIVRVNSDPAGRAGLVSVSVPRAPWMPAVLEHDERENSRPHQRTNMAKLRSRRAPMPEGLAAIMEVFEEYRNACLD